jgi:hypothetical protein
VAVSAAHGGWPGWRSRLFLAGQSVSLLGDGLAALAVPLLVLDLTSNPVAAGIAAAAVTIGYLLVGLPAGVLVDRFDPWPVMMLMDAARALMFAALFAAATAGVLTVSLVLAVAVLAGACSVFFETALVVAVKDLYAGPGLLRANSAFELVNQLSLVIGPAAVGLLAAAGSIRAALFADAVTFAVSLLSLTVLRRAKRPRPARGRRRWREAGGEVRAALRYLLSVRLLVVITAVQVVVNLCLGVEKLIIYFARVTLALGPLAVGAVVAAGGAGGVLGALTAAWLAARLSETRLVFLAVALAGAAVAAMSTAGSFAALAAVNLGYAWAVTVASLVNRTKRQRIVPAELLGRVTSTVRMLFLTADPLGVVLAGTLTAALGGDPRPVFLLAGVIVVVAATAGWASLTGPDRAL